MSCILLVNQVTDERYEVGLTSEMCCGDPACKITNILTNNASYYNELSLSLCRSEHLLTLVSDNNPVPATIEHRLMIKHGIPEFRRNLFSFLRHCDEQSQVGVC